MSLFKTVAHLFHPRRSNNHRARILHPEVLMILALLMIGVFSTMTAINYLPGRAGGVLGFASSITPSQVIEMTNAERAREGLPPLTANPKLSSAALAKGQDMLLKQYWAHTSPEGTTPWKFIRDSGYGYQVAGENLARDFGNSSEMVAAWMASPTHRANIMSNRYQEIGIAVIDGNLEGVDTTLVVQMFGTPRTAVAQVAPTAATPRPVPTPQVQAVQDPAQEVPAASPANIPAASPVISPELVSISELPNSANLVLASTLVERGDLRVPPLFTPLQILKAIFLALIIMIVATLTYDSFIIGHRSAMRLVGHNLAHLLLLGMVAFLLISFKGGVLG